MSQGTPVIVSNTSSLPEVCGDAAVYVDPNDSDGIEKQMQILLHDAPRQTELGMKGFARVKQFSWEQFMKAVLQ